MAKTISQINIELFYYKCCLAELAIKAIAKEVYGSDDTCLFNKLRYGILLQKSLECPERILDQEIMTQAEYEEQLEKLNNLCGCVTCEDPEELINDTLPTGLKDTLTPQ